MKPILVVLAGCAICVAPAFSQATGSSTADQKFVDFAAQTDMLEAHLAQMGQDRADAQAVKDYAQMLNSDHTTDYTQLSNVASKAGLNVPKGLDAKHEAMVAPFEKLKGAAFDHRYVSTMISGHTQALAEYKREAANGQNPDLKAYANAALPVLQKHLDNAKDLAKPHKK